MVVPKSKCVFDSDNLFGDYCSDEECNIGIGVSSGLRIVLFVW